MLSNTLQWMTGAKKEEQKRVLLSFLALLFLLLSYYLVKPLRDSQFLKEYSDSFLPVVYLANSVLSLILTKIFNFCYDRIPRYWLIILTYGWVVGCKVAFFFILPMGGKLATIVFFFWAATYFLLSISILWGCINTIFSSEQGERVFGFIAVGATIGNIIGSSVSSWVAESAYKDYALLISAAALCLGIFCILTASQGAGISAQDTVPKETKEKAQKANFFSDLVDIFKIKYVRGIAVMVFVLAFFVTVFDFQSKQIFNRSMAAEAYHSTFEWLEKEQQVPHDPAFELVYTLKEAGSKQAQETKVTAFLAEHKLEIAPTAFFKAYAAFKDLHEVKMRTLFSDMFFYQGILGAILLLVTTRFLFQTAGLKVSALILPLFFIGVGIALYFPLELMILEGLFIINGALNYSLNNATKELLYTPTSDETKFKHKPLIEGPIMRFGDALASGIKLLFSIGLVTWLGISRGFADGIMLGITLLLVLYWAFAIGYTGKVYDTQKSEPREH